MLDRERSKRRVPRGVSGAHAETPARSSKMQQAVAAGQAHTLRNHVIASLAIFVVLATAIIMMMPAISVTSDTIGEGFSETEPNIVDFEGNAGENSAESDDSAARAYQPEEAPNPASSTPRKAAKRGSLYAVVDSSGTLAATATSNSVADPDNGVIDLDIESFMDHADCYGIIAEEVSFNSHVNSNVATKKFKFNNATETKYYSTGNVPSIFSTIEGNGQFKVQSTGAKGIFYVAEGERADLVHKDNANNGTVLVRNRDELEDKVELLITRTLDQAAAFTDSSRVTPIVIDKATIERTKLIDLSSYPEGATIVFDADALNSNDNVSDMVIKKKPGQNVVFNFSGNNVTLPLRVNVDVVDGDGSTTRYEGKKQPPEAGYDEIFKHIIWNSPNADVVNVRDGSSGVILAEKQGVKVDKRGNSAFGWIISRGTVAIENFWYGFSADDTPFRSTTITKVFHGVGSVADIDPNFYIDIRTNENKTTNTSNAELIDRLVISGENTVNAKTENGKKYTELGYATRAIDSNAQTVTYTWVTQELAVGNEHSINEANAKVSNKDPMQIGISTWDLVLDTMTHTVHWDNTVVNANSVADAVGFFGISDTIERNAATVDNYYQEKDHYDLSVTKKATGTGYNDSEEYTFTIELRDENGKVVTNDRTLAFEKLSADGATIQTGTIDTTYKAYTTPVEHSGQFTLKIGQKIVFTDIPKGWHYKVLEASASDEYQVNYLGCEGVLNWDRQAVVTNSYEPRTASLVVTKTVNDPSLLPDTFQIVVRDQDDSAVAVALRANSATKSTAANGDTVYTWTLTDRLVNAEYTVEEQNATNSGYNLASTASVNGVPSVYERKAEIKIADGADANRVDFTNIYEKIPTDADLHAKKILKDAQGETVPLTSGQFGFLAQEATKSGDTYAVKQGGATLNAGNFASGDIIFGELDGLAAGTHYYILSEDTSNLPEGVEPGGEAYLAQVDVQESTSVGEITSTVAGNTEDIRINGYFNAPESGDYSVLLQPDNKYSSQGSFHSNGGNTSFSFTAKAYNNGSTTYYLAKPHANDNGADSYAVIRIEYTVDWNNGGKRTVTSINFESYGESTATQASSTITYYALTQNASGQYVKNSETEPIFTNTLTAEVKKADIQLKKVDGQNKDLAGATFRLYRGTEVVDVSAAAENDVAVTAAQNGQQVTFEGNTFTVPAGGVDIQGLDDGIYTIEEVAPPAGYVIAASKPVVFTVQNGQVQQNATLANGVATQNGGVFAITNNAGTALPNTGGPGSGVLNLFAVALLALSAALSLRTLRGTRRMKALH